VIVLLFVAGCATTGDLRRIHGNLDHQIRLTNEKIAAVEQRSSGVKDEIAGLRGEDEKAVASITALRGTLADSRAEVTEIREQIQQIKGSMDSLRRDLSTSATRTNKREDEEKGLREKLDKLTFKINFIENFLGIGQKKGSELRREEWKAAGGPHQKKRPPSNIAIGQGIPLRGRL
jgi:chromosome segregation ATPase